MAINDVHAIGARLHQYLNAIGPKGSGLRGEGLS